jgi:hypothetical protein
MGPGDDLTNVQLETGLTADDYRLEHGRFPLEIGSLRFVNDQPLDADWLVETFDFKYAVTSRVPRARRILVLTEPDTDLAPDHVNQFGILVAPQRIAGFTGIWYQSHGALPNRFAIDVTKPGSAAAFTYEELVSLKPPEKRDAVAVVFSRKSILPGHRQRQRFVRRLKQVLGDRLDIFGDGYRKIGLKADAILPYKYHLALENTVMPSYWTEKVADAYLGYALPLVSGPPDLSRWFPEESFIAIDLDDIGRAIDVVVAAIDGDVYVERVPAIVEARRRVIFEERLCPVVARVIAANPSDAAPLAAVETILPAPKRPPIRRIAREIRRIYGRLDMVLRP